MSTLRQLQAGLGRAWESLAEGWHYLRERAGHALTRFRPVHRAGQLETAGEQAAAGASRWGLLAAEVHETPEEISVKLEAPGMDPDDFDLQVVDEVLVVRGEKRVERSDRRGAYRVMECAYGAFERAIPLPCPVEEAKARARYRRGILHVQLPKSPAARTRHIEVEAG